MASYHHCWDSNKTPCRKRISEEWTAPLLLASYACGHLSILMGVVIFWMRYARWLVLVIRIFQPSEWAQDQGCSDNRGYTVLYIKFEVSTLPNHQGTTLQSHKKWSKSDRNNVRFLPVTATYTSWSISRSKGGWKPVVEPQFHQDGEKMLPFHSHAYTRCHT